MESVALARSSMTEPFRTAWELDAHQRTKVTRRTLSDIGLIPNGCRIEETKEMKSEIRCHICNRSFANKRAFLTHFQNSKIQKQMRVPQDIKQKCQSFSRAPASSLLSFKRQAVTIDCKMAGAVGGENKVILLCVADYLTGEDWAMDGRKRVTWDFFVVLWLPQPSSNFYTARKHVVVLAIAWLRFILPIWLYYWPSYRVKLALAQCHALRRNIEQINNNGNDRNTKTNEAVTDGRMSEKSLIAFSGSSMKSLRWLVLLPQLDHHLHILPKLLMSFPVARRKCGRYS